MIKIRSFRRPPNELMIQLLSPLLVLLLLPMLLLLVDYPPQPEACTRLSQAPNARLGQVPPSASAKHCCYYYRDYSSSNEKKNSHYYYYYPVLQVLVSAYARYL